MRFSSTLLFISIMNETDTARSNNIRACLHGGGGPQIGEVTCGGSPHLSCKHDEIKMRDYTDKRVTHKSGLPHLPGVPHLRVNRPEGSTHGAPSESDVAPVSLQSRTYSIRFGT